MELGEVFRSRRGAFTLGLALALISACSSDETSPGSNGRDGGTGGATTGGSDAGSSSPDAGGAGNTGGTGNASGGTTGACIPDLARCGDEPDGCCDGSVCVPDEGGEERCRQTCTERADCTTFCCVEDAAVGAKLCAAESMCPFVCVEEGGECLSPGPECCAPLICVASTSTEFAGCRPPCETSDDCAEGCCVPFANSQSGFCITGGACTCAAEGETCGGVTHCCDGLTCSTFDETGAFACHPSCTDHGDCASNCCVQVAGTGESACLPSEWCSS